MRIIDTELFDVKILEYEPKNDNRGKSVQVYNKRDLEKNGIDFLPVEQRIYTSKKKGTVYGIHYQRAPKEQAKVVYCLQGKGLDYAVDLRPNSKTYLKWVEVLLSENDNKQIYIPKGFGHIFLALEDNTINVIQIDEYFDKEYRNNYAYNDPLIGVKYPLKDFVLAPHDMDVPFLITKKSEGKI